MPTPKEESAEESATSGTSTESEAKPKRTRKPAAPKVAVENGSEPAKKTARSKKNLTLPPPTAHPTAHPTEVAPPGIEVLLSREAIALRAYFIAENRQSLGIDGNAEGDWLEAERQLRSESLGIAASLHPK